MPDNNTISLSDIVNAWLARLTDELDRKREKAIRMLSIEDCPYTRGELQYAKAASSAIRWIRSRIPAAWTKPGTGIALTELQIVAAASRKARPRPQAVPDMSSIGDALDDVDINNSLANVVESIRQAKRASIEDTFDLGGES